MVPRRSRRRRPAVAQFGGSGGDRRRAATAGGARDEAQPRGFLFRPERLTRGARGRGAPRGPLGPSGGGERSAPAPPGYRAIPAVRGSASEGPPGKAARVVAAFAAKQRRGRERR